MAGGLRYETGRDMPPGMAEKVAAQIARQMEMAASAAAPETPSVAGSGHHKEMIHAAELQDLQECLDWDKEKFPDALAVYAGIVAKPYTVFQYFYENGDYIGDSDTLSLKEILEKAGVEVIEDAK